MQYRALGKTGLRVSEISLGTVQLGLPYGVPDKDGNLPSLTEAQSLAILDRAYAEGVNFLDTARNYGNSEAIIGRSLKRRQEEVVVATKLEALSPEMTDDEMAKAIRQSIEQSRRALDRETIDLLQVHNAAEALLDREVILDLLAQARHREWIRYQGVTTYGVSAPEKAIEQGYWDTVQVEFNLFNQQVKPIFDLAAEHQAGLIIRSAMLKGAMTATEEDTPEPLKELHRRAQQLPDFFERRGLPIPQLALLYVLSHPAVSTVLTGVISIEQLLQNLAVSQMERLQPEQLEASKALHIPNPALTDPRLWQFDKLVR